MHCVGVLADLERLAENDSWAQPFYVGGSPEAKERMLFSGAAG
jgi:hypothetical protein